ncbi:hypothetical protein QL285_012922 [Trifolium repens]|jgi:hypothetical protein|nr:hypothetical protein QL285_012922 [Trifolium repens]
MELRLIDEHVRGKLEVNIYDHSLGYISWYYRASHLKLTHPAYPNANPPRPIDLEVVTEEQAENDVVNTFAICRYVRKLALDSIEADEVVEGSPTYNSKS